MATIERIPGYIDLYRASEIIGVSHSQVWQYINNGLLDSLKIGRTHLVKEKDAKSFVRPLRGNPTFREQSGASKRS